jgi:stage IV sporulation protein FB
MQVARIFGVRILLDKYFLLLLLLYGFFGLLPQVLVVFTVVFIHELAHVLVAYSYGYHVREIQLLPFGGVAKIEDLDLVPLDPLVEINIALAGPLQNILLAGLGFILKILAIWQIPLANFFIYCNLGMAMINLLPVLPLDGGRVCRAYLVRLLGYQSAMEKMVLSSRIIGGVLLILGLIGLLFQWFNITFFFIALFILFSIGREQAAAAYIFIRFMARKKQELMEEGVLSVRVLAVTEYTSLREVVQKFVPKKYHFVLVLDNDHRVLGTLSEAELVQVVFEYGMELTLKEILANRP